mmetsp:Transcript_77265/g.208566  ORF Transcript_77265/g.208566 Transcript_77265/m.208566 type:complete len:120 (-) Transcript_77265:104-463(-)
MNRRNARWISRMADETNHLNSQEGWDDLVDPVLNPSSDSRSRSLEKQLHAASMFAAKTSFSQFALDSKTLTPDKFSHNDAIAEIFGHPHNHNAQYKPSKHERSLLERDRNDLNMLMRLG